MCFYVCSVKLCDKKNSTLISSTYFESRYIVTAFFVGKQTVSIRNKVPKTKKNNEGVGSSMHIIK